MMGPGSFFQPVLKPSSRLPASPTGINDDGPLGLAVDPGHFRALGRKALGRPVLRTARGQEHHGQKCNDVFGNPAHTNYLTGKTPKALSETCLPQEIHQPKNQYRFPESESNGSAKVSARLRPRTDRSGMNNCSGQRKRSETRWRKILNDFEMNYSSGSTGLTIRHAQARGGVCGAASGKG